jgi:hypothetical protein
VPKPNYHQAKKQKELARKARQQVKQQRRTDRVTAVDETTEPRPVEGASVPRNTAPGNGT